MLWDEANDEFVFDKQLRSSNVTDATTDSDGAIQTEGGISLKKDIFVEKGLKVYEQKNAIKNDCTIGTYYITPQKFKEMKRVELVPNDIIISCSGTMGRIAIVPSGIEKGIIRRP